MQIAKLILICVGLLFVIVAGCYLYSALEQSSVAAGAGLIARGAGFSILGIICIGGFVVCNRYSRFNSIGE